MSETPDQLEEAVRKSVEALRRMTPEQRRAMRQAQRRSWVIGEMLLEHPEMSREEAEHIYASITDR